MITRVFGTALVAGFLAACVSLLLQVCLTTPLILQAERYEGGHDHHAARASLVHLAHADSPGEASSASGADAWKPAAGMSRIVFTGLATLVGAVGYAFLLLAVLLGLGKDPTLARGLVWAAGGFAAFSLAPAIGLPPELPGMGGDSLQARQLWWLATVLGTGAGLYLVAAIRRPLAILLGLAVIVAPHVVGAPSAGMESTVPAALAASFAARSIAVSAVFWVALGLALGWAWQWLGADRAEVRIEPAQ